MNGQSCHQSFLAGGEDLCILLSHVGEFGSRCHAGGLQAQTFWDQFLSQALLEEGELVFCVVQSIGVSLILFSEVEKKTVHSGKICWAIVSAVAGVAAVISGAGVFARSSLPMVVMAGLVLVGVVLASAA